MLSNAVNKAIASQVRSSLVGEPNIESQIGKIESLEFDFTLTFEEAQKANQTGQEPPLVFRIRGSKGSGKILILQDPSGNDQLTIKSGTLIMQDGSEYPLEVEAVPSTAPNNPDLSVSVSEVFGVTDSGEPKQDESTDPDEPERDSTDPADTDLKTEDVQSDGGGQ